VTDDDWGNMAVAVSQPSVACRFNRPSGAYRILRRYRSAYRQLCLKKRWVLQNSSGRKVYKKNLGRLLEVSIFSYRSVKYLFYCIVVPTSRRKINGVGVAVSYSGSKEQLAEKVRLADNLFIRQRFRKLNFKTTIW
jgi:hypothetical protein